MTARLGRLLTCALIALSGAVTLAAGIEAGRVDEYRVKAAFLFNFARLVEWPAEEDRSFRLDRFASREKLEAPEIRD